MIYLRVGRIDIFLVYAFGARVEQSTTKTNNLAANAYPREYDTPCIAVDELTTVVLVTNASLQYELLFIALAYRLTGKRPTVLRVIAELKLAYYVVAETTTSEILHTNSYSVGVVLHLILKIFHRPLVDNEHTLTFTLLAFLVLT